MNVCTTINSCRICTEDTKLRFLASGWPLNICKKCGFQQIQRQPTREEIHHIYSNKYFSKAKYSENNYSLKKELERRLHILEKTVSSNAKVIDIGCGIGDFLSHAGDKFDMWGRDISEDAILEAKKSLPHLKHKLSAGMIEEANYESQFFDAIVLWDVIEHLWDPKFVTGHLLNYIKPSGYLIFSTPYTDAFTAKLLKTKWAFMTPPEHLSFFNKSSIIQLFKDEFGCNIKLISPKGKWVNLGFLMYKLDKVFKNKITGILKKIFSGRLSHIPLYIPTNDIVYVVVQKGT